MYTFRTVLCDYLIRLNNFNLMGQKIRQSICQNSYFQIQTVFQRFDRFHKTYLIPANLSQFMLVNQIYPNETQLYVLFRQFDKQRIGTITFQNFKQQILTKQNQRLKINSLKNKYYPPRTRLQLDLEFLIAKLIKHKIQQHQQLQVIRSKLRQLNSLYQQQAFILIDKQKKRYLTLQDIDYFLRSSGKVLKSQQIKRIYNSLNFNQSNKLDKQKFISHINPLFLGYYIGYTQRIVQKSQLQKQYLNKKYQLERNVIENKSRQLQLQSLRNSQRKLQNIIYEQQLLKRNNLYRHFY